MTQEICGCYNIFINKLLNPHIIDKPLAVHYMFYFNPILRKFINKYGHNFYTQILHESCLY